jgi:hypothetical protein
MEGVWGTRCPPFGTRRNSKDGVLLFMVIDVLIDYCVTIRITIASLETQ